MMNQLSPKEQKAIEKWGELGQSLRHKQQQAAQHRHNQRQQKQIEKRLEDYNDFFLHYFKKYATYPLAEGHKEMAVAMRKDAYIKAVWEAFRGYAKSVHGTMGIPIWLMLLGEVRYTVVCSDTVEKAQKLIGRIRKEVMENEALCEDFGIRPVYGDFSKDGFAVMLGNGQQCYFKPIGVNESPRGLVHGELRPDLIICDDTDTSERCRNPYLVQQSVDWITKDLMFCFGSKGGRFLVCNSRVDDVSILQGLINKYADSPNFYYQLVNALDENDQSTWEPAFPTEKLRQERASDFAGFMSERQNKPMKEGGVFNREMIDWVDPLDWTEYDALVMYCDPSFSIEKNSDHTAIKLWGIKNFHKTCLKAYVRNRETIDEAFEWWYDFLQSLPSNLRDKVKCSIEIKGVQQYLVEQALTRLREKKSKRLRLHYDRRKKGDKADRINDMLPDYRDGLVHYSQVESEDADMQRGIQHLCTWNEHKQKEDDSPDADEAAWHLLEKEAKRKKSKGGFFTLGGVTVNFSRG